MYRQQDEEWYEFGDIGTYIEDVEKIYHFEYSTNIGSARLICPTKDGGCGAPVVRLKSIWIENSKNRVPLNDLGREAAPPRKPLLTQGEPVKPGPYVPPIRHKKEYPKLDMKRKMLLESHGAVMLATTALVLLISMCTAGSIFANTDTSRLPQMVVEHPVLTWVFIVIVPPILPWFTGKALIRSKIRKIDEERLELNQHEDKLHADHVSAEKQRHDDLLTKYKNDIREYKQSRERYGKAIDRHRQLYRIWQDSWYCKTCVTRWRSTKIDRSEFIEL